MIEKKRVSCAEFKFFILLVFFIVIIITSFYLHSIGFKLHHFRDLADTRYGPFIFILLYAATSFIPLPFAPTSFVGPILYPLYRAFLYTFLGSLLFSFIMFYIARFLGKDFVDIWLSKHKKLEKFDLSFKKFAVRDIILLRFFFLLPAELVNILAGLSKVSFKNYFFGTFIGNMPVIFFSCALVRGQIKHDTFAVLTSLIGLVVLLIVPLFFIPKLREFFKKD